MSADNSLDDYRISSPIEIQSILQRIIDGRAMVTLSGPGGASYTTMLWSTDAARGVICFNADDNDPRLNQLLATNEIVAVAYLDSIKVQFELDDVVKVRGADTALNARYPRQLFRFQRRSFFRVKPLVSHAPTAHITPPTQPDQTLALRILDISLGGVALSLPPKVPMLPAGVTLRHCQLALDEETQLTVDLVVHHITVLQPESHGARLGCEMVGLQGEDERALQHYINQTQKRRAALTT
ncbi:MAG TPA: flagellar brake protein [Aquabacterium sp.]|uniref:flagellar brake protein n=1 Tax=Aquabacterium sp. TaxID=1872578 RepID=UPI002E35F4A1|nr:flagellar brake protein [Aquabacterium sp.]HEX5373674.1 flagellar brake protein [Aquabacterium sp.]